MKDIRKILEDRKLEIARLTHQNWLILNKITKKDRIHFKLNDVDSIKWISFFNPKIKGDFIYFDNIYKN